MTKKLRGDDKLRYLIAHESAKIIAEEGVKDFKLAKQKAANRLELHTQVNLPSNTEIEVALQEYQRLFKRDTHDADLKQLRLKAAHIMDFMDKFSPRLTGSTLNGLYSPHQEVHLHVFAETLEEVMFFLMDHNIPFVIQERRYRFQSNTPEYHPVLLFGADGVDIDITVFTNREIHDSPLSPIDGKPMRRANLQELKLLIQTKTPPA